MGNERKQEGKAGGGKKCGRSLRWGALLAGGCLALLAGCGDAGGAAARTNGTVGVEEVLAARIAEAERGPDGENPAKTAETRPDSEAVDAITAEARPDSEAEDAVTAEASPDSEAEDAVTAEASPDSETVDAITAEAGQSPDAAEENQPEAEVDVDLTALSSTMVYSEVYNMMVFPEDYIGKTVRMEGAFNVYYGEASDIYYFACIIQDAAACCAQGIEFVLDGEYAYPDDYPEPGEEITVTGIFDTYVEGLYTYCTLRDARMVSDAR